MGYSPGFFLKKQPNFDPCEFTRNRHRKSRNDLEIILEGLKKRLTQFGAITRTYQNRRCSKPWAIAQGFCSKTAKFRPLRIHLKSTETVAKDLEIILEWFRRYFREFGAISRTYQNRPCSKPWAIAQGFCSKTAKFRPLRIHLKSTQTVAQRLRNNFRRA